MLAFRYCSPASRVEILGFLLLGGLPMCLPFCCGKRRFDWEGCTTLPATALENLFSSPTSWLQGEGQCENEALIPPQQACIVGSIKAPNTIIWLGDHVLPPHMSWRKWAVGVVSERRHSPFIKGAEAEQA